MKRDRQAGPKPRLFYGWVMVGALALVLSLAVSMAGTNVALFVKPMSQDLDISQAVFGWAYAARLVAVGVSAPIIGRLLDQYGARWMLAGASLLTGVMILSLAFVSAPWEIVALFAGLGLVGFVGGSQLYTMVPVAKWFVRRRGRAVALTFIGGNLGMIVLIPLTQWIIDEWGWRTAWFLLGSVGGVAIAIISVVFIRRRPEDMGLLPDGALPAEAAPVKIDDEGQAARDMRDEQAMSRHSALRTSAFWRLAIVFGLMQFAAGTRVVYSIPFFVNRGISPQLAALGLSSAVLGGMTVTLVLIVYGDRFQVRYVGAIGFLLLLGSTLLTIATTQPWQMFPHLHPVQRGAVRSLSHPEHRLAPLLWKGTPWQHPGGGHAGDAGFQRAGCPHDGCHQGSLRELCARVVDCRGRHSHSGAVDPDHLPPRAQGRCARRGRYRPLDWRRQGVEGKAGQWRKVGWLPRGPSVPSMAG